MRSLNDNSLFQIGLPGPQYAIWRDSEKSASGSPRYPTVTNRHPVPTDKAKSRWPIIVKLSIRVKCF